MLKLRKEENGRPLLVGHRGAMDAAPENTLASLEAGRAGGADILEIDAQLTADGQVILFHDYDLAAKTGVSGAVHQFSAAFLQSLDVGAWFDESFAGERMPLLAEALAWAHGRIPLMIELKHGPVFNPALDEQVTHLVERHNMVNEVILISFDQFALRRVKKMNPNLAAGLIFTGRLCNPLSITNGAPVDALSPATNLLTRAEVETIRNAGYACSPGGFYWNYEELLDWGVDTVSSNNPAETRPLLDKLLRDA
ncbi:MAG: glycerophosphodiester phosphodiesterase [Chloroflexi bacterium]|nr:glycerophosphodiester phosphodiesterase [Chloroflexota bacterium]